jgi:TctA family transporter
MVALVVGIVFLLLGVLGFTAFHWADEFIDVLQGSLPPIFILSGLAALALGVSQIRDKASAKKEEEEMAAEEAKAESPPPEAPKTEAPKPAPAPQAEKKEDAGQ